MCAKQAGQGKLRMSEYTVLRNAPITEALLDIQGELPPDTTLESLASLQEEIKDRFPNRQERGFLQFEVAAKEGSTPELSQTSGIQGYLFVSPEPDATKVVQARLNGFTFSKLRPYQNWSLFRGEAYELWERYVRLAKPITVTRLGLRFINRIELPLPFREFNQFILTVPEIAPELPSDVSEFFMRLVMPQPEQDMNAIVTVATNVAERNENFLPLIFDIDVFQQKEYEPSSETIWHTFDLMRRIKNDIFFKSITDKTARLFE